jgi:hypothetical protein
MAELGNDVSFVVNCYDVSPTLNCCKGDQNECYSVDEFPLNYKLELIFVRLVKFTLLTDTFSNSPLTICEKNGNMIMLVIWPVIKYL